MPKAIKPKHRSSIHTFFIPHWVNSCFVLLTLKIRSRVGKLWPVGQNQPLPIFINKALLELGHTHSFPCQLWLLWLQEKSNCDGCNHKAKSIYHLYRKQPNKLMSLIVGTYSQGHSRVTGVGQGEVSVGICCSAKCSPNQSFHYHQSPLDTVQIRILSP